MKIIQAESLCTLQLKGNTTEVLLGCQGAFRLVGWMVGVFPKYILFVVVVVSILSFGFE